MTAGPLNKVLLYQIETFLGYLTGGRTITELKIMLKPEPWIDKITKKRTNILMLLLALLHESICPSLSQYAYIGCRLCGARCRSGETWKVDCNTCICTSKEYAGTVDKQRDDPRFRPMNVMARVCLGHNASYVGYSSSEYVALVWSYNERKFCLDDWHRCKQMPLI